jgi:hypothetical protein
VANEPDDELTDSERDEDVIVIANLVPSSTFLLILCIKLKRIFYMVV